MIEVCSVRVRCLIFTCSYKENGTHFSSQFYLHHLWNSNFDQYLCLDPDSHSPDLLDGNMVEVCSVCVRMSLMCKLKLQR